MAAKAGGRKSNGGARKTRGAPSHIVHKGPEEGAIGAREGKGVA